MLGPSWGKKTFCTLVPQQQEHLKLYSLVEYMADLNKQLWVLPWWKMFLQYLVVFLGHFMSQYALWLCILVRSHWLNKGYYLTSLLNDGKHLSWVHQLNCKQDSQTNRKRCEWYVPESGLVFTGWETMCEASGIPAISWKLAHDSTPAGLLEKSIKGSLE